ncbi:MAG: hypothetical protein RTU30_15725 [Candidatus Thorarchaeota archaeon]
MAKIEKVTTAGHGGRSSGEGFVAEFVMTTEEATKLVEEINRRIKKHPSRHVRVNVREDHVYVG